MRRLGITGASGFLGWHLRCHLSLAGITATCADRATFASTERLDEFVDNVDAVFHLAGVNRAESDDEVHRGNVDPAQALVDARARTGARFDVVYAGSVKAGEESAYGQSKAMAAELLAADARAAGVRFVDVGFPHLFGEFGRPFYNSAVATFAHQLASGQESVVNEGWLELLHVQDACRILVEVLTTGEPSRAAGGRKMTVPECYELMARLAEPYLADGSVPELGGDGLELDLFNTIRAQMWPDAYPMPLRVHADERGAFFEVLRSGGMGQTSISTTVPGVTRGEHFHVRKIERFTVLRGRARIRVRRLFTTGTTELDVTGDVPVAVDMPTLCTHDITNVGDSELVTLFWANEHFDPAAPDTYPLAIDVGVDGR